jgi:hypothetical protein
MQLDRYKHRKTLYSIRGDVPVGYWDDSYVPHYLGQYGRTLVTKRRKQGDHVLEFERFWILNGFRCAHERCCPMEGCHRCMLYVCPQCHTVKDWANGGTDDTMCDECWTASQEQVQDHA